MSKRPSKRLEQEALRDLKTTYTVHSIGGEVELAKHRAKEAIRLAKDAEASHKRYLTRRAKVVKMVEEQMSVLQFTATEKSLIESRRKMLMRLIQNEYNYKAQSNQKLTLSKRISNWFAKLWQNAFRSYE